MEQTIS